MGYETPNIDRIAKEGIRFLHYYGEQSCTAGRAAFLTGQHGIRTGLTKVGFPGAPMGMSQLDPSIGGLLQEPRLRHRPVRQEPRRRPQRVAADGQRLRRVLRQPLPPQRRGGAGAARLSEGPGVPREVRPARRAARCKATDVDDPTVDPRFGKVGKQTIEDTGAAHQEADGDDRRRDLRRGHRLHEAAARGRQAVLLLVQRHAHAPAHARPRRAPRPLQARRQRVHRRHDRARRHDRHAAQGARRHGHRRQHDRRLHERQRPAHEHLAGRRDDAVPLGEEHQLGGRVPRAVPGPLARRASSPARSPTS